jgi:uncharacterized membrane protein
MSQLWWRYLHIAGAFGFLAAHGVAVAVAMRLRRERDPVRCRAILDLSRASRPWMYASLVVLIVAGVIRGTQLHAWGQRWIWAALALLVAMLVAAVPLAVPYYARVRRAVAEGAETDPAELERLLRSPRPLVILWVETAGLLVILWLMIFKPLLFGR